MANVTFKVEQPNECHALKADISIFGLQADFV